MKVNINKLPKSEIELKIEVPTDEWHEFIDEAARELSADLKIEGFRPGHVPAKMVEEKVGADHILEHAAEHCAKKCYVRAILDNHIEAIGRPEISVTKLAKDNPFEFSARVAVMPEVSLPDYKKIAHNLQKDKKQVEIKEDEVNKAMDWLQKSRTKYVTVRRPAQAGDRVEIDFEGNCQGEKPKELASKNHPAILGKGYFMAEFEKNLIGMKEGEEKKFNVFFPDNFEDKQLAGKMVEFQAKMNLVQEGQLPELNDQFAQSLGDFKDLSGLRQSVKKGLLMEKEIKEKERWRGKVLGEIGDASKMEIPQALIDGEADKMLIDLKTKIEQTGLDYAKYLEKLGKNELELLKEFTVQAQGRVRNFLVLRQIAKKEKIQVSQEELAEEISKALKHFETIDQAQSNIDSEQLKEYTEGMLKNEKIFQLLEQS